MLRSWLNGLARSSVGPQTALGRWCGVWYNETCDAMSKGSLADADNSAWPLPPLKGKRPSDAPRNTAESDASVKACTVTETRLRDNHR